jgi:hypothetical protein
VAPVTTTTAPAATTTTPTTTTTTRLTYTYVFPQPGYPPYCCSGGYDGYGGGGYRHR